MTTPVERARALVWAGGFLVEVALDESLPADVRQRAVTIARHFPTAGEVSIAAALQERGMGGGLDLATPVGGEDWARGCRHGPLTLSTQLPWPDEKSSSSDGAV